MRPGPVWLWLAGSLMGAAPAAAAEPAPLPAALTQPALISPRALHALTLDVAHAGTRLVGVGEHGIVLLSDDGGSHWRQAASVPVSVTLTAVRFGSASEGWAVGHMGVILHTTDAGETWQRQIDGIEVAALVRKQAEALADPKEVAAADQLLADGPDKPFLDLAVTPRSVLAVGAYGIAVRSTDGGQSWSVASDVGDKQGLHLYGLSSAGDIELLAGEQGFLAQSTKGGTFQPIQLPESVTLFGALALPDGVRLAFGLGGRVVRAAAGEETWAPVPTGRSGAVTCAVVLPNGHVLIGTNTGELALGDAGGRNFEVLHGGPPIPIAAMLVDGTNMIFSSPFGPVPVALEYLDPDL